MLQVNYETRPCFVCGKTSIVPVNEHALRAWRSGTYAQDAFPELSPETREMLISGTHPACWDLLYSEE